MENQKDQVIQFRNLIFDLTVDAFKVYRQTSQKSNIAIGNKFQKTRQINSFSFQINYYPSIINLIPKNLIIIGKIIMGCWEIYKLYTLFLISNSTLISTAMIFLIEKGYPSTITPYHLYALLGIFYVCDFLNLVGIMCCKRMIHRVIVNILINLIKPVASVGVWIIIANKKYNDDPDDCKVSMFKDVKKWWECTVQQVKNPMTVLGTVGMILLIFQWVFILVIIYNDILKPKYEKEKAASYQVVQKYFSTLMTKEELLGFDRNLVWNVPPEDGEDNVNYTQASIFQSRRKNELKQSFFD